MNRDPKLSRKIFSVPSSTSKVWTHLFFPYTYIPQTLIFGISVLPLNDVILKTFLYPIILGFNFL